MSSNPHTFKHIIKMYCCLYPVARDIFLWCATRVARVRLIRRRSNFIDYQHVFIRISAINSITWPHELVHRLRFETHVHIEIIIYRREGKKIQWFNAYYRNAFCGWAFQPIILLSGIAHEINLLILSGLIYINIKRLGVMLDKKFR